MILHEVELFVKARGSARQIRRGPSCCDHRIAVRIEKPVLDEIDLGPDTLEMFDDGVPCRRGRGVEHRRLDPDLTAMAEHLLELDHPKDRHMPA